MHTRQLITSLILIVALVVSADAGTTSGQVPLIQMEKELRLSDPQRLIVSAVQFYGGGMPPGKPGDDLQIVVQNRFHRSHHQERYQAVQLWTAIWRELNGPASRVFVTDRRGNVVARGTADQTWVQKP
jgi:hypothetical protein